MTIILTMNLSNYCCSVRRELCFWSSRGPSSTDEAKQIGVQLIERPMSSLRRYRFTGAEKRHRELHCIAGRRSA